MKNVYISRSLVEIKKVRWNTPLKNQSAWTIQQGGLKFWATVYICLFALYSRALPDASACSVKFDATTSDVILNVWFIQQTTLYLCRLYCTNHCDIVFPTKLPVTATGDFAKCKLRPMLKVRGQLDLSSFRGRWMSSKLQLDVCDHNQCSAIWWTLTRWRQAWCFEVKMCDPCRRRFTTALYRPKSTSPLPFSSG